jgi:hypothetical protein
MTQIRMQETTTLRGRDLQRAISNQMENIYARYRPQGINITGSWSGDTYSFRGGPANSLRGTITTQDMRDYSIITVDATVPSFGGAPEQFRQEVQRAFVQLPGRGQYPAGAPATTQTAVAPGAQAAQATETSYGTYVGPSSGMTAAQQEAARLQEEAARAARQQVAGDIFGQIGLGLQQIFGQGAQQIAYDEAQAVGYPAAPPGEPIPAGYAPGKPGAGVPGAVPAQEQGFFQSVIDFVKPAPPEGYVAPGGAPPTGAPVDRGEDRPAAPPSREPAGMPGWFWGVLVAAGLATAIGVTYMLVKKDDEDEEGMDALATDR